MCARRQVYRVARNSMRLVRAAVGALCASLRLMYNRFFGLAQAPFSIAPDPRYLFMSERHREALAHLLYGLNGGGGFVLLTGEIGAGKTTVCRLFLEQVPAHCNVAYVFNPKQTVLELLQSICDEFGVPVQRTGHDGASVKDFIDSLNAFLLRSHGAHRNNVLIIDEAQNLSADVLEQLRLLTNLETNERKLLQIVLIGQPELRTMLAAPELEQLAQRVIARFHLAALTAAETAQYIAHRLAVAGNLRELPFSGRSLRQIHLLSRGIPRRINLLCDRALLGAYAVGKGQVDSTIIAQAAREVFDQGGRRRSSTAFRMRAKLPIALIALLATGVAGYGLGRMLPWPANGQLAVRVVPGDGSAQPAAPTPLLPVPAPVSSMPRLSAASPVAPSSALSSSLPVRSSTLLPLPARSSSAPTESGASVPIQDTMPGAAVGAQARELGAAFRQLGRLWNLNLGDGDPCSAAQRQEMYCFTSMISLSEIRGLDRPGIVTLHDDENRQYYGVLTGLGNQGATLQIGERTGRFTLSALARRWHGVYRTFWHGPHRESREITIGVRGADVDWLATRLARVNNLPEPAANARFDDTLRTRVREFQVAQGLAPDGIPGVQTMMRLASATDGGEPHLRLEDKVVAPIAGKIDPTLVVRRLAPSGVQPVQPAQAAQAAQAAER